MKKKEQTTTKKICRTDSEFEELYLPGPHEKKKIQESIREPEKLKEALLRRIKNGKNG
ncbi:MAG TPA: hypothetical protein VMT44_04460 [Methanoregula sp.]|nr:hypothetical protein [Methanoregula sp.]